VPKKSSVHFRSSPRAVQANAELLAKYDFDLERLLDSESGTTVDYDSEFRPIPPLKQLMGDHPIFGPLAQHRKWNGLPLLPNYHSRRARGNHKSAKNEPDQIDRLLKKEVDHGFAIPVPIDIVAKIKHSSVQPIGLAKQLGLSSDRTRKIKYRMTQDLSYSHTRTAKGLPVFVNGRIGMDAYSEMIFGWCLLHIIHLILLLRLHFPHSRILISKYDYSDAYRRMTHSASAAAQTIAVSAGLALIAHLRWLSKPPSWTLFSVMVTDLANEITQCAEWEPSELHSPAQPIAPAPVHLSESISIALASPLGVIPPPAPHGRVDGFTDAIINLFPDTEESCAHLPHIVPLAIFNF
jgi:hypothetical protein